MIKYVKLCCINLIAAIIEFFLLIFLCLIVRVFFFENKGKCIEQTKTNMSEQKMTKKNRPKSSSQNKSNENAVRKLMQLWL